ncbi:MAG: hypothetical protein GX785_06425 [Armatimonadetes bacterium]|jgi:hypothetical protein|nr:hypothetical protein [Armatimonadota bacterium]
MRRAHYAVIVGVAALACAAYVLGGAGMQGERAGSKWWAPVGADTRGTTKSAGRADDAPDALLLRLVGEWYGIPEPALAQAARDRLSPAEVALAANIAARVGRPFAEILECRKAGQEWDAIGRRFGLEPPMLAEPIRPPGSQEDEALFRELLSRNFQLGELEVARLRREGFAMPDIVVAAVLAGGDAAAVSETLHARKQGESWQRAGARFVGRRLMAEEASARAAARRGAAERNAGGADTAESTAYARALLTGYYGVRPRDVDAALNRGVPAMELLIAANAAARSGQEFSQVLQLRGQGLSWREIERRLGLAMGDLCKLPDPGARRTGRPGEGGDASGAKKAVGTGREPGGRGKSR